MGKSETRWDDLTSEERVCRPFSRSLPPLPLRVTTRWTRVPVPCGRTEVSGSSPPFNPSIASSVGVAQITGNFDPSPCVLHLTRVVSAIIFDAFPPMMKFRENNEVCKMCFSTLTSSTFAVFDFGTPRLSSGSGTLASRRRAGEGGGSPNVVVVVLYAVVSGEGPHSTNTNLG